MGEETHVNNEKQIVSIYRGQNNGMINFGWLIKTKSVMVHLDWLIKK